MLQNLLLLVDDDETLPGAVAAVINDDAPMELGNVSKERQALYQDLLGLSTHTKKEWCSSKNGNLWEECCSTWDKAEFMANFRCDQDSFAKLHRRTEAALTKQDTNMRQSLKADKKLAITLRYLAGGAPFRDLGNAFGVGVSTVREAITDTVEALVNGIDDCVGGIARTHEEFAEAAAKFASTSKRQVFPNALGAVDGSHIPIRAPELNKEAYWCYKKHYSMLLLAVAQEDYSFSYFTVGYPGRRADGGIFTESNLLKLIANIDNVYHILGDSAFPLLMNVMCPYPESATKNDPMKKHFNFILSSRRMCVEQAFGRLKGRFRVLLQAIEFKRTVVQIQVCFVYCQSKVLRNCFGVLLIPRCP